MCADVILPDLGFGIEQARLLGWLKRTGDPVRRGEPIAEIESDKTTVELAAAAEGVLKEILVSAGMIVPVNTVLARIHTNNGRHSDVEASDGADRHEGRYEVPITPMRQAIARAMLQSARETPQFFITSELDVTQVSKVLPARIGFNALMAYLTVQTLKEVPELNATYENGKLYHYHHVHLSMAVALENGLIAPVLRRADSYGLAEFARQSATLIRRARAGGLHPRELSGGTFTISNLGMIRQVDHFTSIVQPPQIGILAVGAIKDRAFAMEGGLHVRKTVHLTLTADHRFVDGLSAARFLEIFDQQLQAFPR